MWFIRDGCGIVFAVVTWFLVLYAEFVVLFVMLIPSGDYMYSAINGIVFSLLAFLALASHCRAMLTDPGAVPKGNATKEFIEILQLTSGQVLYNCPKCCSIKPDRAHHCRVCKRCIRKMDHHCPWINNCVGEKNQKYFVLFTVSQLPNAVLTLRGALAVCLAAGRTVPGHADLCLSARALPGSTRAHSHALASSA